MASEREDEEYRVPVNVHRTWWAPLLVAMLLLSVAWNEFYELDQLETGARKWVLLSTFQKLLYEVGGKWAAVGFFVPATLFFLVVGTLRLVKDRRGST